METAKEKELVIIDTRLIGPLEKTGILEEIARTRRCVAITAGEMLRNELRALDPNGHIQEVYTGSMLSDDYFFDPELGIIVPIKSRFERTREFGPLRDKEGNLFDESLRVQRKFYDNKRERKRNEKVDLDTLKRLEDAKNPEEIKAVQIGHIETKTDETVLQISCYGGWGETENCFKFLPQVIQGFFMTGKTPKQVFDERLEEKHGKAFRTRDNEKSKWFALAKPDKSDISKTHELKLSKEYGYREVSIQNKNRPVF